jgi:hypothetical protein
MTRRRKARGRQRRSEPSLFSPIEFEPVLISPIELVPLPELELVPVEEIARRYALWPNRRRNP